MGANSYNICPRCGNSNSLSAKYCSRCGGQLKVPEEPVVCHKCHTHNSPIANFCRNCGAELKVGLETKICPRCGKEVDAHDNVCACGYSFVTFQQTAPKPVPLPRDVAASSAKSGDKVRNTKGGRGWAVVLLVVVLLFAYYLMVPATVSKLRPAALNNLDGGLEAKAGVQQYGADIIINLINEAKAGNFVQVGVPNIILGVLVAITALTMVVSLVIYIVRLCVGKRPKRGNGYYFVMFVFSLIVCGLFLLFNHFQFNIAFIQKIGNQFLLPEGYTLGYAIWGIPAYYLLSFLFGLGFRAKVLKEHK